MSMADDNRPLYRHIGPNRRMGLLQSLRRLQDNVISLYPPYIFDKDWSARRFAFQTFILVNQPDLIREMLVDKPDIYRKGRISRVVLGRALGEGLLTSEGEFWRRQRRIAAPAFQHRRLETLSGVMVQCANACADRLDAHADSGHHIDLAQEMMRLTMDIVTKALFSTNVTTDADRLGGAITILIENFGKMSMTDLMGLPEWLPRPHDRRVVTAMRTLETMIYRIIEERRAEGEGAREDLLQMLMDARDPETGEGMSDKQLRDEILTLFAAGHETTSQSLTWAFYLLDGNRDQEEMLHAELDRVLGGRAPCFDDMLALDRSRMIFDETLRLFPPVFSIVRTAEKDDNLGGVLPIPKGAIVTASPYITHRNPKLWPDPERFDPERFADREVYVQHKHTYFPFGGGPRTCIGSGFAQTEGRMVLAVLGQRLRFRLKPGHPVQPQGRVTLRPRFGMKMRVERR